jgi:hypothetical protein
MTNDKASFEIAYEPLVEDTTNRCFTGPCGCGQIIRGVKENWLFLRLLLWKNYLLFRRNIKTTIFQVLVPIAICVYLIALQAVADEASDYSDKDPDTYTLSGIEDCYGDDCITLGVSLSAGRTAWTDYVLSFLVVNYGLEMGKDIQVINEDSPVDFIHYLSSHENKTQTGVIFCTGAFDLPDNEYVSIVPCPESPSSYSYSLLINSTLTPSLFLSEPGTAYPKDYASLSIKLAIDTAILNYEATLRGQEVPELSITLQEYPIVTSRYSDGYNVVTTSGAFYFFIPPMVTFVVLLIEIVREKEYRLRQGLAVMGMSASAYWQSWFWTGMVFILMTTNALIAGGYMCQIEFFLNTDYSVQSTLFASFSLAMMMVAFFLSTLLRTTKAAYTASYGIILVGLALQFMLSDVRLVYYMYSTDAPDWVVSVRTLLPFYPPFNFSKAFGDIAHTASDHYNDKDKLWVDGSWYGWDAFVSSISGEINGTHYEVYSAFVSCSICLGNSAMFAVLAWFCDHIIESNRGSSE